jgi:hypothetical protein
MARTLIVPTAVAAAVMIAASVTYGAGLTGTWVMYLALVVAMAIMAPVADRWDQRHHR